MEYDIEIARRPRNCGACRDKIKTDSRCVVETKADDSNPWPIRTNYHLDCAINNLANPEFLEVLRMMVKKVESLVEQINQPTGPAYKKYRCKHCSGDGEVTHDRGNIWICDRCRITYFAPGDLKGLEPIE